MQRATMEDVAREAGVSRALVSIAYRGAPGVSPDTREMILRVGKRLSYRPNRIAAQLARNSSDAIGVFLLNLRNEVFADIYDGIRSAVDPQGTQLVLSIGTEDRAHEADAIEALIGARVGVIIAAGLLSPDQELHRLANGVHIVNVARHVEGMDSVYSDDVLGARMAVEHLIQLGHRRIMHLASPLADGFIHRRVGYHRVMAEAGLAPQVVETEYSRAAAATAVGPVLDSPERPTAIFANNDQTAFGVLDALYARGLRCPEDLSLVGYDNTPFGSVPTVALTSVDIHGVELGRRSALAASLRLDDPTRPAVDETIQPTLMVRASTSSVS